MGAWGHEPFDNDDSGEIREALEDGGEFAFDELFDRIEAGVTEPDGTVAVAAAAMVGAAKTGKMKYVEVELEEAELDDWFKASKPQLASLAPLALKAVRTIRADSELKDLWSESEDFQKWDASLAELEKQLG